MATPINLLEYFNDMCARNIIFSFKGVITEEILADLGEIIKNHISDFKYRPLIVKRVFSIFIEVAQNILHHSAEKVAYGLHGERGSGIVMVVESDLDFEIISGNLISNSSSKSIEESCKLIHSLDKEGLKKAFRQRINEPLEEGNKGAGLGLLDIARKAENRVDFKIDQIDDDHSFFLFSVKIEKQEATKHGKSGN